MATKKVDPRVQHIDYECTRCGGSFKRDALTVKRVDFATMGEGFKRLKTRTVGWLCKSCREIDPDWNLPARSTSPGMKNTRMTRG